VTASYRVHIDVDPLRSACVALSSLSHDSLTIRSRLSHTAYNRSQTALSGKITERFICLQSHHRKKKP